MPNDPEKVPWRAAVQLWCDPDLLEKHRQAMLEPVPPPRPRFTRSSKMEDDRPTRVGHYEHQFRQAVIARRKAANLALVRDLRERIASGEIILEGVQVFPTLGRIREQIPALWAPLIEFRDEDKVRVKGAEFESVFASRRADLSASAAPAPLNQPVALATVEDLRSPPPEPEPSRRPRGRTSYAMMIETYLRANWDGIQKLAARSKDGRPNMSQLAKSVCKRLNPNRAGERGPQFETTRKHLRDIYPKLLVEMTGQK